MLLLLFSLDELYLLFIDQHLLFFLMLKFLLLLLLLQSCRICGVLNVHVLEIGCWHCFLKLSSFSIFYCLFWLRTFCHVAQRGSQVLWVSVADLRTHRVAHIWRTILRLWSPVCLKNLSFQLKTPLYKLNPLHTRHFRDYLLYHLALWILKYYCRLLHQMFLFTYFFLLTSCFYYNY